MRGIQLMSQMVLRRSMSTNTKGLYPNTAKYKKFQEMQKQMLADDGLMVWQKRGLRDNLAYQGAVGLCVIGMVMSVYSLYKMSFPDKS